MLEKEKNPIEKKDIKNFRHSKEKPLLFFWIFITWLFLLVILISTFFKNDIIQWIEDEYIKDFKINNIDSSKYSDEEILKYIPEDNKDFLEILDFLYWPVIILIPLSFFLFLLYMIWKMYGGLIWNSVKLNKEQYPEVYKIFVEMSKELGMKKIPELYLVNWNWTLNAYATCVPGYRNVAAIYSDILERCLKNNDMDSLKFILWHELWHIKLNHVKWWYIFSTIWMNLPWINLFFGLPLSRAREYGCDKIWEKLSKDSSGCGLMMLTSGKYAYKDIHMDEYLKEHFEKSGFWAWVANLHQGHWLTAWRIAAIRKKHQAGLIFRNKK